MTDLNILPHSFDEELTEAEDAETTMGSRNHSLVQTRLAVALNQDQRFTAVVERSLEIGKLDLSTFPNLKAKEEIKPDVSVFPGKLKLSRPFDELRMTQWPALAIEVLSPQQGSQDILAKFNLYFAQHVKSCWLVDPTLMVITVYATLNKFKVFDLDKQQVKDDVLEIGLPLQSIFE